MQNNLIIRTATDADKETVIANQVASQEEEASFHPSRQRGEAIRGVAWEMIHARQGIILVAEQNGQIIGHVGGAHALDASPFFLPEWQHYSLIFDLYILPAHRRKGIGSMLVREMLSRLEASGATRIRIVGLANNPAALALYRAIGFAPYEVTMEKVVS
jgi:ribosomal protein S18 acetylase RimI-like enzyme